MSVQIISMIVIRIRHVQMILGSSHAHVIRALVVMETHEQISMSVRLMKTPVGIIVSVKIRTEVTRVLVTLVMNQLPVKF